MKKIAIDVISDDAVEIMMPVGSDRWQRKAVCLCCQRANQAMEEDGCGICDACLGVPFRTFDDQDDLEFSASSSHLSITTRIR